MTIALYRRVSSNNGHKPKSQEPNTKRWARAQAEQVAWYKNRFTGTTIAKPSLEKLLADVWACNIANDYTCGDLSTWARQPRTRR
jgi:hypothetical protein